MSEAKSDKKAEMSSSTSPTPWEDFATIQTSIAGIVERLSTLPLFTQQTVGYGGPSLEQQIGELKKKCEKLIKYADDSGDKSRLRGATTVYIKTLTKQLLKIQSKRPELQSQFIYALRDWQSLPLSAWRQEGLTEGSLAWIYQELSQAQLTTDTQLATESKESLSPVSPPPLLAAGASQELNNLSLPSADSNDVFAYLQPKYQQAQRTIQERLNFLSQALAEKSEVSNRVGEILDAITPQLIIQFKSLEQLAATEKSVRMTPGKINADIIEGLVAMCFVQLIGQLTAMQAQYPQHLKLREVFLTHLVKEKAPEGVQVQEGTLAWLYEQISTNMFRFYEETYTKTYEKINKCLDLLGKAPFEENKSAGDERLSVIAVTEKLTVRLKILEQLAAKASAAKNSSIATDADFLERVVISGFEQAVERLVILQVERPQLQKIFLNYFQEEDSLDEAPTRGTFAWGCQQLSPSKPQALPSAGNADGQLAHLLSPGVKAGNQKPPAEFKSPPSPAIPLPSDHMEQYYSVLPPLSFKPKEPNGSAAKPQAPLSGVFKPPKLPPKKPSAPIAPVTKQEPGILGFIDSLNADGCKK